MKIIFEKSPSGQLVVYIHCVTAAQHKKLSEKLFRHSEYLSKWDELCDEWIAKDYFKYVNQEDMLGNNSTITVLTIVDGRNDDLIKELSIYLEDEFTSTGCYIVEYQSFKSN